MDGIKLINGITAEDMKNVIQWTNSRGADFLCQWAGPRWKFPLTEKQITDEIKSIYSIMLDGKFVGMIQIVHKENLNAHIGRFIKNPNETGKGIGKTALKQFCQMLFSDEDIHSITLNVYDFNESAQKCYLKCGFEVVEKVSEEGQPAFLHMQITR